jgi:hypothetical protein
VIDYGLIESLVEYWRNKHQRMNKERFFAANAMALVTHAIVCPDPLLTILGTTIRFSENQNLSSSRG